MNEIGTKESPILQDSDKIMGGPRQEYIGSVLCTAIMGNHATGSVWCVVYSVGDDLHV